jgi:hypothetical protein
VLDLTGFSLGFASHGIRTGVLEASKLLLKKMAPNVSDLQVSITDRALQSICKLCNIQQGPFKIHLSSPMINLIRKGHIFGVMDLS